MADIAAFEAPELLLACIVQPWAGDVISEGVLQRVLGMERVLDLILPPLKRSLGLSPAALLGYSASGLTLQSEVYFPLDVMSL